MSKKVSKCDICGKNAPMKSAYGELYCVKHWRENDNLKRDAYGKRNIRH